MQKSEAPLSMKDGQGLRQNRHQMGLSDVLSALHGCNYSNIALSATRTNLRETCYVKRDSCFSWFIKRLGGAIIFNNISKKN